MYRNLIFDWSGTIVDDLGPVVDATAYVFDKYDLSPMDREAFRRNFQLPYGEWWAEILPQVDLSEIERLFRIGFAESPAVVPVLDHAREALDICMTAGVRLFVLSSMDEPAFQKQLKEHGLEDYFEATYVGVLDKREVIEVIMQTHSLVKEETAFIGDMIHDVETAHHAGVASIAVTTGYNHPEVLVRAEPTVLIQDLRHLARMIQPVQVQTQKITIRGLKVSTHIGVPDEERSQAQTLTLHIDMWPHIAFDQLNDDVAQTVDYHAMSIAIEELARKRPRKLIETLANDVVDLLLEHPQVTKARVEIEKVILEQTDHVGCVIEKGRS